jgi:tetratricopeptide (TPR) repeat protein
LRAQEQDNAAQGLADLQRATDIAPENVEYSLALADAQALQNQLEDAEAVYQRLVEANTTPGHDAALIRSRYAGVLAGRAGFLARRARLKLAQRQITRDEAAKSLEEAVELYQEAVELYEQGIELAGEDPEDRAFARVGLATHLFRVDYRDASGDPERQTEADEMFASIEKLLIEAIDPNIPGSEPDGFRQYLLLADLYSSRNRHTDAIAVCEKRIDRGIDRKGIRGGERKRGLYLILVKAAGACVGEAVTLPHDSQKRQALLDDAQQFVLDAKSAPCTPKAESCWPGARISRPWACSRRRTRPIRPPTRRTRPTWPACTSTRGRLELRGRPSKRFCWAPGPVPAPGSAPACG